MKGLNMTGVLIMLIMGHSTILLRIKQMCTKAPNLSRNLWSYSAKDMVISYHRMLDYLGIISMQLKRVRQQTLRFNNYQEALSCAIQFF